MPLTYDKMTRDLQSIIAGPAPTGPRSTFDASAAHGLKLKLYAAGWRPFNRFRNIGETPQLDRYRNEYTDERTFADYSRAPAVIQWAIWERPRRDYQTGALKFRAAQGTGYLDPETYTDTPHIPIIAPAGAAVRSADAGDTSADLEQIATNTADDQQQQPDAPPARAPGTRKSRALPDRPELDEAAADLAEAQLLTDGWTRYRDVDADISAAPDFAQTHVVRSFWTRIDRTPTGVRVRPEPWVRKRSQPDTTKGRISSLDELLHENGWLRAADAPAQLVADADADPAWQVTNFFTADNPATTYHDPHMEEWIRPITPQAIYAYNNLALTTRTDAADGGGGGDDDDGDELALVPAKLAPTPKKNPTPKKKTPARAAPRLPKATNAGLNLLGSIAQQYVPNIRISPSVPKSSPYYGAQLAISKELNAQANTLLNKATSIIANTAKDQATKTLARAFITQPPAPVETRSLAQALARQAAGAADAAPLGYHYQLVTGEAGQVANILVPDIIEASASAIPMSILGPQIETIAADIAIQGLADPVAAAAIGGADVAAANIAGAAASEGLGAFAFADLIPWVGGAFAVYGIGRALGLWGPSGLYAQSTGHHLTGTFDSAGFSGIWNGLSSNGKDHYEFPQSATPAQINAQAAAARAAYAAANLQQPIPIDLYTGLDPMADLAKAVQLFARDPAGYMAAYAAAHQPPRLRADELPEGTAVDQAN